MASTIHEPSKSPVTDPWAFLDPWWGAIAAAGFVTISTTPPPLAADPASAQATSAGISMSVYTNETVTDAAFIRLLDALELLALLRAADADAWWMALPRASSPQFPVRPPASRDDVADGPVVYILWADHLLTNPAADVAHLERLFGPDTGPDRQSQPRPQDPEFVAARARLLALADGLGTRHRCESLRIPFALGMSIDAEHWDAERREGLSRLGSMAMAADQGVENHSPLTFKGLQLMLYDVTEEMIGFFLDRVFCRSVPLSSIHFGHFAETILRGRMAQFMAALGSSVGPEEIDCRLQLEEEDNALSRFLSAMMTSSRARRLLFRGVYMGDTPSQRRQNLLWLLLTLFSQHARHGIEHFEVDTYQLSIDAFNWVKELLARNPIAPEHLLVGTDIGEDLDKDASVASRPLVRAIIPPNTPIRTESAENVATTGDCGLVLDHEIDADILIDDPQREWLEVHVPQHGPCSVRRAGVVVVDRPPEPWKFDTHPIRSLDFVFGDVDEDEKASVRTLLQLVGMPVQRLRLERWFSAEPGEEVGAFDHDFLIDSFLACPNVDDLQLSHVRLATLETLVEAYAAGICRARTLSMKDMLLSTEDLLPFLLALGNPQSAIAQHVEHLTFGFVEDTTWTSEVTETFATMLTTNKRLREVVVDMPTENHGSDAVRLQGFHGQAVSMPRAPVSLAEKIAFLSLVDSAKTSANPICEAIARLDTPIIARIFAFAAECFHRDVVII